MRVAHTESQLQPVPASQLATPSDSNFNFYTSPPPFDGTFFLFIFLFLSLPFLSFAFFVDCLYLFLGVIDYYEQSKRKKKKENMGPNESNNILKRYKISKYNI